MKTIKSYAFTALVACLVVLNGCNGNSDIIDSPGSAHKYILNGFFVQDVNVSGQKPDYNYFSAQMTRNTLELSTAQLFFGNSALSINLSNSVYVFTNGTTTYRNVEGITLRIVDSTLFTDTISTAVLDSIYITNYPDSTIPNTNGTQEFVEWSAVLGVDGYIVAVVLTNSAYSGAGYSSYVEEDGTSTTIQPDAFRVNLTQALDTGWYDYYIYGYTGSPDFLLSTDILPVPLPTQLPDNISHANLAGHFGSIVVSRKKMIHVVSN